MNKPTVQRILFLDHAPIIGGAEFALLNFLRVLDRERFVPIVATTKEAEWLPTLANARVEIATVSFGQLNQAGAWMPIHLVRAAWGVARVVRGRGITLIHSNTVRTHVVSALAARIANVPVVWTLHDDTLPKRVVQWLSSSPIRVIAVSGWLRNLYAPYGLANKIVVIPNGMDPSGPIESGVNVRTEFQIPASVPFIINVGRLVARKAPHIFIEAARLVADEVPSARFGLVGGPDRVEPGQRVPEYTRTLAHVAKRSMLGERLVTTGQRADVARFYAAADLVVQNVVEPEGFPLVLLEAMRAGKPVIASALGGALEIVEPGVTGELVPPGDVRALADAMLALLRDPVRARKLGAAGSRLLKQKFDLATQARKIENVYTEIYENRD